MIVSSDASVRADPEVTAVEVIAGESSRRKPPGRLRRRARVLLVWNG